MKRYGLIGFPLEHSFSKKYFTEKFKREQLADHRFELYPLQTIKQFPELVATVPDLHGLAVTIPYKETVIPYLSFLSKQAEEIGAVNCIKISGKELRGYNTDVIGFERSFIPLLQTHHTRALVLGTGGASKAVQFVLKQLQIPFILVTRKLNYGSGSISYQDIDKECISGYSIIINCSPAGMFPNEQDAPLIPYHLLTEQHYLYDLVYKPEQTRFMTLGAQYGAIVKNGFEMLVIQAEENYRIWNDDGL